MHVLRLLVVVAVGSAALIASEVALGVGPWPGLAQAVVSSHGNIRYTASRADGSTIVRAVKPGAQGGGVVARAELGGAWGIPAVTSTGVAGGLSPDGRRLVLSEAANYGGLRSRSRFLVLSTATLAPEDTIVLNGEFGFDALSPEGRTLYVIQHRSRTDLNAYVVRAYDLVRKRLLPGTIVAKGETGSMRGYPVARATSRGGTWVYTLYNRMNGKPFIHALNARRRSAVCIDLSWVPGSSNVWLARLVLSPDGRRLVVRSGGAAVSTVDTTTLRVR
jgi:hypothetical protein